MRNRQVQSKLKVVKKLQEDMDAIPVIGEDPMLRFQFVDVFLGEYLICSHHNYNIPSFSPMISLSDIRRITSSSVMSTLVLISSHELEFWVPMVLVNQHS